MHKRIALLIIGFVLAAGAFLLYQFVTGSSFLSSNRPPGALVTTAATTRPLLFESRSANGDLRYIVTAKAVQQLKRPHEYELTDPVATFYTHDGRAISIRGDICDVSIDQVNRISSASSGGKDVPNIRDGKLSGNVVLTVGSKPGAIDTAKDSGDMVVRFDSDLVLDNADQLLSSPGKVQVRSNTIAFDGEGFTLSYSIDPSRPEKQRIEYFRIDKGNKIILKKRGAKFFASETTTKPAATAPATRPAAQIAAATSTAPATNSTTYRLTFGKDVTAKMGNKPDDPKLTSEELYVLFMTPSNNEVIKEVNKPEEEAVVQPRTAATLPKVATTRAIPKIDPMGEPADDDMVITWVGPMVMRPADNNDVKLVDGKDVVLEAVGSAERPVKVGESKRSASAGKLWYHKAEQRLELEPGTVGQVEFAIANSNAKGASVADTTVVCQGVSVYLDEAGQTATRVRMVGPGRLQMPPTAVSRKEASSVPVVAMWSNTLDADLGTQVDPKDPKKKVQVVKHAVLNGASIKDADFSLDAQTLDLVLANLEGSSSPTLAHMLATGNVDVKSFKKGDSGLQAQRLEVLTAVPAGAKLPLPTTVIADGQVSAWQNNEKKASPNAKPSAYKRQTIFGPHMVADLVPAEKKAAATTQVADSGLSDFGAIGGGSVELKQFMMDGGIRIEMEPTNAAKDAPVVVTADSMKANLPLATLTGGKDPVRIVRGEDRIEGAVILLDQSKTSKEAFTIPGPGKFALVMPAKKGKESTPLEVTWTKQMQYDQFAMLATFMGDVLAQTTGKASEPATLKCDRLLEVKLHPNAAKPGDSGNDVASVGADRVEYIKAEGNVDARATQLDGNNKILTDLEIFDVDSLTYDGTTKGLTIPGKGTIVRQDLRPEKAQKTPDAQSSRGQTRFAWLGSLNYDTEGGLITFKKSVQMVHVPLKPFHMGNEKEAPGAPPKTSKVEMNAEILQATLIHTKEGSEQKSAASPIGLGAGGNFTLSTVTAGGVENRGAVSIRMDDYSLFGYSVNFDVLKNLIDVEGNESVQATAMRANHGSAEADGFTVNLTEGAKSFHFKNGRGNIEAMSDPQN